MTELDLKIQVGEEVFAIQVADESPDCCLNSCVYIKPETRGCALFFQLLQVDVFLNLPLRCEACLDAEREYDIQHAEEL